jgi:hypothetical protein
MAQSFVFIVVVNVLAAFRVEKPVRDGCVIEPSGAYTPGIFSYVLSFSQHGWRMFGT